MRVVQIKMTNQMTFKYKLGPKTFAVTTYPSHGIDQYEYPKQIQNEVLVEIILLQSDSQDIEWQDQEAVVNDFYQFQVYSALYSEEIQQSYQDEDEYRAQKLQKLLKEKDKPEYEKAKSKFKCPQQLKYLVLQEDRPMKPQSSQEEECQKCIEVSFKRNDDELFKRIITSDGLRDTRKNASSKVIVVGNDQEVGKLIPQDVQLKQSQIDVVQVAIDCRQIFKNFSPGEELFFQFLNNTNAQMLHQQKLPQQIIRNICQFIGPYEQRTIILTDISRYKLKTLVILLIKIYNGKHNSMNVGDSFKIGDTIQMTVKEIGFFDDFLWTPFSGQSHLKSLFPKNPNLNKYLKVFQLCHLLKTKYANTVFVGLQTFQNDVIVKKLQKFNVNPDTLSLEQLEQYDILIQNLKNVPFMLLQIGLDHFAIFHTSETNIGVYSIGRQKRNDIQINDTQVSRYHCFIKIDLINMQNVPIFYLYDGVSSDPQKKSTNGTFKQLKGFLEYEISESDQIYFGQYEMTYKIQVNQNVKQLETTKEKKINFLSNILYQIIPPVIPTEPQ